MDAGGSVTLNDDISALSAARLFEDLTGEQLRLLAFGAERLRFPAGRTIYRQGERADCGFVLDEGSVELVRESAGGESRMHEVGSGAILGQLALITETSWMTSARARTDTEVLRISRSLFRRMLAEYPETAMAIHAQLAEDLQRLIKQIERVEPGFRNAPDL